ncbi:MAG: hypothetical protein QXM52_00905 [Candidatus Bathyarchaeia archaeon]
MAKKSLLFKEALMEAVDEGLLILGESGREVVYFHLQHSYGLKKENISENPEIFMDCLRKIFGLGAQVIEKAIIKILCYKLGIEFAENKNYPFARYLNYAKSTVEGRS